MVWQVTPLLGFMPDAPKTLPGVITSAVHAIPSERGMRGAPSLLVFSSTDALAAQATGAFSGTLLNGNHRLFAGTTSALYELINTSWTDRSAGGGYSGSGRWSFAQFGDNTLATNDSQNIQISTTGGASFAAVANAPKARIVITPPNFAVAFNTQNGSASNNFGDSPDRWWSSAYQNPSDWAINAANQCVSERLVGDGGEITAAVVFGSGWVAFKAREMYHAYYTGDDSVFTTQRVPGVFGCVGPNAACNIGGAVVFVGEDDIYLYDGARVVSIAEGAVRRYLFDDQINRTHISRCVVLHEPRRGLVWVFYPNLVTGGGEPNASLVWSTRSRRWGVAGSGGEAPFEAFTSGVWTIATIDTNERLAAYIGAPASNSVMSLKTWEMGSDNEKSSVTKVQLLCDTRTFDADDHVLAQKRTYSGGPATANATPFYASSVDGACAVRQEANWHAFQFNLQADFECSAVGVDIVGGGIKAR